MSTYRCPTAKDPTQRKPAAEVSSVFMDTAFTFHAYSMAHDGKTFIVHLPDGIEIHRQGKPKLDLRMHLPFNPRDFLWHPDSKRVAFWCMHTPKRERVGQVVSPRRSIAVMDVSKLGTTAPAPGDTSIYEVIYSTHPEHTPFGLEWSPKGDALFVVERGTDPVDRSAFGLITRIDLNATDKPKEIVRMPGDIDFFMPPVSRFERGEGASSSDYLLLFGHIEGLYTVDPDGRKAQQLSDLPAVGLYNIEWNPNPRKNEVVVFFRRPVHGKGGRTFVGVYLVRVDRLLRRNAAAPAAPQPEAGGVPAAPAGPEPIEQLYDGLDIHTLWYSPKGTYVTWASPWGLWYRRPDDPPSKAVQVIVPPQVDGAQLEIKGVTWSDDERKLAFTAGHKLFVVELPGNEPFEVYSIGRDTTHFLAEPRFIGDEVFVSSFEDAQATGRVTNKIQFGMPGAPKDVTQGRGRVPERTEGLADDPPPAPPAPPPAPPPGGRRRGQ